MVNSTFNLPESFSWMLEVFSSEFFPDSCLLDFQFRTVDAFLREKKTAIQQSHKQNRLSSRNRFQSLTRLSKIKVPKASMWKSTYCPGPEVPELILLPTIRFILFACKSIPSCRRNQPTHAHIHCDNRIALKTLVLSRDIPSQTPQNCDHHRSPEKPPNLRLHLEPQMQDR